MKKISIVAAVIASFTLVGCSDDTTTNKNKQARKAEDAANSINFSENAEIENIKKRLELTSKPGMLGYITLTNRVGQIVLYAPVKGKVTSGSKRLTKPWVDGCTNGNNVPCGDYPEGPSDEGTYGSSNPYIYFWTVQGQYIQTDKPLRLKEPAIVDLTIN
jgi:hypothetical protein